MKTKTMSALLRAVLLAAGALLAVFFFLFLPFYGTDTQRVSLHGGASRGGTREASYRFSTSGTSGRAPP